MTTTVMMTEKKDFNEKQNIIIRQSRYTQKVQDQRECIVTHTQRRKYQVFAEEEKGLCTFNFRLHMW